MEGILLLGLSSNRETVECRGRHSPICVSTGDHLAPGFVTKSSLGAEHMLHHPDYRRFGAGDLVVQWGTNRAHEMGVEAFVESTELAKPLYAKHGFVLIDNRELKPIDPSPSEEWKRLERELLPLSYYFM